MPEMKSRSINIFIAPRTPIEPGMRKRNPENIMIMPGCGLNLEYRFPAKVTTKLERGKKIRSKYL